MPFPYIIKSESEYESYLQAIKHAQNVFKDSLIPILGNYFPELDLYYEMVINQELNIDYRNPLIYTRKEEYILYMLLIEYSNQFMKERFVKTSKKVVILPRCVIDPNSKNFKIKRSKIGWHEIIQCNDPKNNACKLMQIDKSHNFDVYITMGSQYKEPNFSRVFRNLNKTYGYGKFGLLAVACIPELALGRTYIMEMGIPTQAVPLLYSGCTKWHETENVIPTEFPLKAILEILKVKY